MYLNVCHLALLQDFGVHFGTEKFIQHCSIICTCVILCFQSICPFQSHLTCFHLVHPRDNTSSNDLSSCPRKSQLQRCWAVKTGINPFLDVARQTYSDVTDEIYDLAKSLAETYELGSLKVAWGYGYLPLLSCACTRVCKNAYLIART